MSLGVGVLACADLLQVSERTVRNWEAGATRIPYAAYKLLRVMRGGKFLGPVWHGWYVRHDKLVTPEGHVIEAGGMAWWSLMVRMARAFQRLVRDRASVAAGAAKHGAIATGSAAPDAPLALSAGSCVCSALSILPATAADGKDPSPESATRRPGAWTDASIACEGKDSKSLKAKGFPTETLSLTIQKRPRSDAPPKAKNSFQPVKAVRA